MNTSLKILAFVFTAALPSTIAADVAGLSLPATFDLAYLFGAFVTAFVVLTAFADYARASRHSSRPYSAQPVRVATKSTYRLAA
jgi:hypothetical protein